MQTIFLYFGVIYNGGVISDCLQRKYLLLIKYLFIHGRPMNETFVCSLGSLKSGLFFSSLFEKIFLSEKVEVTLNNII